MMTINKCLMFFAVALMCVAASLFCAESLNDEQAKAAATQPLLFDGYNADGCLFSFLSPETLAAEKAYRSLESSYQASLAAKENEVNKIHTRLFVIRTALYRAMAEVPPGAPASVMPQSASHIVLPNNENVLFGDAGIALLDCSEKLFDSVTQPLPQVPTGYDEAFNRFATALQKDIALLSTEKAAMLANEICELPHDDFPFNITELASALVQIKDSVTHTNALSLCLLTVRNYQLFCHTLKQLRNAEQLVLTPEYEAIADSVMLPYEANDTVCLFPLLDESFLVMSGLFLPVEYYRFASAQGKDPASLCARYSTVWKNITSFFASIDDSQQALLRSYYPTASCLRRLALQASVYARFLPATVPNDFGIPSAMVIFPNPLFASQFTLVDIATLEKVFIQKSSSEQNKVFAKAAALQKQVADFMATDVLPADLLLQGVTTDTYHDLVSDYVFADPMLQLVINKSARFSFLSDYCNGGTVRIVASELVAPATKLVTLCRKYGIPLFDVCSAQEVNLIKQLTKANGNGVFAVCGNSAQTLSSLATYWTALAYDIETRCEEVALAQVRY